jgi:hypothetical protein
MDRISPALFMQVVGMIAGLLVVGIARAGAAQEVRPAAVQYASPPLPPATSPTATLDDIVASVTAPDASPTPMTVAGPTYYLGTGVAPAAPRVVRGPFDTIAASIFGNPDPNTWRSLSLGTLFSEGWDEAWVPSPNGSGGAPRQGWINAADGNFYRLWFFTFAEAFNSGPKSDAYLGAYTLYTPLSRRLLLITNVPFVERNGVGSGLPIASGPSGLSTPRTGTRNQIAFGDITFTPRVMLHETQDFTLTSEVAVTVPTGNQPLTGKTALTPALAFWNNFAGRWVIRGAFGDLIPLGGGGHDTLISQLAIGNTFTDHDVPVFGDFTLYVSAVADTPLSQGQRTSVTLTPGMRTHLGRDWYFLAGLPTPLTSARVGDIGTIFWFMKVW